MLLRVKDGTPSGVEMGMTSLTPSTLPTDVKNKPWLAVKMIIYAGLGFGTPFYAVHYHL